MSLRANPAFTLAELLIALAILGVMATFTIPKILSAQQASTWRSTAKEVAGSLSDALQQHKLRGALSASTTPGDLTQYLNYVKLETSSTLSIDHVVPAPAIVCSAAEPCLRIYNGGLLNYYVNNRFGGTGSNNYIFFYYDPDGIYSAGTTYSISFCLYYDGRVLTTTERRVGDLTTVNGTPEDWGPSPQSSWFSW